VVCGAWNFDIGDLVPLALPGAFIPHDQHDPAGKPFNLTKATIRGVESQGMICSGKELGLSDDGKGIMILSKDYKLGETFAPKGGEAYLDISVPANRPDLLGYMGVAREIFAFTDSKLSMAKPRIELEKFKPKVIKVNISSEKLCSRYIAVRLSGIEVKPSPEFIQNRLRLSGHRPINNVVDITNYVMLETGQPLHAFDAGKINGPINVRPAYVNEKIITLDGVERTLNQQNLVIADGKRAIGIAGVMGGANSAIDEFTGEIILEAANFDAASIRKTSRELGLRTDASIRYEKSLPLGLTDFAAAYAVELLMKSAGAKPLETVKTGVRIPPPRKINVSAEKIEKLLGYRIEVTEQKRILTRLGLTVAGTKDAYTVTVPFMRTDIVIWQDVAEELARFVGVNKIDEEPANIIPSLEMTSPLVDIRQQAAELLMGMGYSEIYTYSFVSEKDLENWNIEKKIVIEVANPQSLDQQYMRPNLLPNMLKVADQNRRFASSGDYFEIGNIYWREDRDIIEKTYLGLVSFDKDYPSMQVSSAFQELCNRLNVHPVIDQESEQIATIKFGKNIVGRIGRLDVGDLKWVGVHLDFEEFIKHIKPKTFEPIIRYPARELDVAAWARKDLSWSKVEDVIRSVGSKLIQKIELFDVYTGKNVPMNKKSMAFRITYQSPVKTLTDDEVARVHAEVLKELKARLNLEVR
jgi:phenylalanyl-tRNA synthetase beta chain